MLDLRIIIVTYKNRSTIERCLSSLTGACAGISWDAVMIDNASMDGTAEAAINLRSSISSLSVIANSANRGFAAACNQGLSRFDARYVLLLNPDTVSPQGALAALVREADRHPRAGIIGPKLLNEDGTTQTSIRRFPSFWSQAGIALKLHNLFPSLPLFRRYFGSDIDLNREQGTDQVMGACFLIRRETILSIGGLDERYFAWFEEVDYCRTAKTAGWEVEYVPSVSVIHGGGHSFAQVFALKKQRIFNASLIAYAKKWWGCGQAGILILLNPISLFLAWLAGRIGAAGYGSRSVLKSPKAIAFNATKSHRVQRDQKPSRSTRPDSFHSWLIAIILLELISALTIFHNFANSVALLAAVAAVALIAWKRPALGLAVLVLELVIGSKGALLQLGGWPGTSLRICIFVAFFIGWAGNLIQNRRAGTLVSLMRTHWEWFLLFIAVAYGVLRGYFLHQPYLLSDANAWGFSLLILPVLDIATRDGERLRRYAFAAIASGILWLAMKTLALEYIFSHGFASIASDAYLWVRRTGVAEVTLITINAFRIFMQSYIWAMVGLLSAIGFRLSAGEGDELTKRQTLNPKRLSIDIGSVILIASAVSLAISLSRSIWMGTVAGVIALGVLMRRSISVFAVLRIVRDGAIALAIVFVVIAFPVPHVDYGSLKTLFGSRLSVSDDAAASRWNLLPALTAKIKEAPILGHGFGATVTYQSKDPRIVSQGKGGMITTYAFEWGWLEYWIKMGILGVLAVALLLIGVGRRTWKSENVAWVRAGSISILVALAFTHFFTPYLNHPLGFGILLMLEGVSMSASGLRRVATN
jgi:GT2 family glycosyltransferase